MEYRNLGKSGLKVSVLSFGAWVTFGNQFGEDLGFECMKTAYEAGVNFFDNAEVYADGEAETLMGKIVKKAGWKRSDLVISTKIFWGGDGPNDSGLSFKHIMEGTNAALKRLQMEYVDLIFCHRPDYHTPVEETVWAMNQVINSGKAFYWGTSEWSAGQIMEAYGIARRENLIPPIVEQPQYHMFHRERVEIEYAPLYQEIGMGTTIWSPLASGLLTGKYNQGIPEGTRASLEGYEWLRKRFEDTEAKARIEKVKELAVVADELNCSLAQLAIAWCAMNKSVSSVVTGASKSEQVAENMKSMDVYENLTPDVMDKIEKILDNKPKPPTDFRD